MGALLRFGRSRWAFLDGKLQINFRIATIPPEQKRETVKSKHCRYCTRPSKKRY
jgi:hypothetical protein